MKRIVLLLICAGANACALLEKVEKTQYACVDSNVTATLSVNGEIVGETPFCGNIPRGLTTSARLKARGYRDAKVPLEKKLHRNVAATSNASGLASSTAENALSLFVPTGLDLSYTSQGRWIEYMPDSYFVEMAPADLKRAEVDSRDLKIKAFALKNFYSVKAGGAEQTAALAKLADLSERAVAGAAREQSTPSAFALNVAEKAREGGQ